MPTSTDIHVADTGTIFLITIVDTATPVDLSSGSANFILFKKPDGTVMEQPASFYTDGADGKIQYTVSGSSILDQSGTWHLSARVQTNAGQWTATAVDFSVKPLF